MQPVDTLEWNHHAVIAWLMREGRIGADWDGLTTALGQQLVAAGAPIYRVRLSMRTLHPLVGAVSSTWQAGSAAIPQVRSPHGFEHLPAVIGSPIQHVAQTGNAFRKRLEDPLGPEDHVVLHELRADGATDYLACPLPYSDGGRAIGMFTSNRPGGYSDTDVEKLSIVASALSPVVEVMHARQTAVAVAEAYLGLRTGRRVLDGQITRGDIETIEAAILVSDIRGWTRLNRDLPPGQAVARANAYFESLGQAIADHGGEILKFLGDGLLAIFTSDSGGEDACTRALAAADQARHADPGVDFGTGLHFGQVQYGNVGTDTRLDFTVLGQAVNMAARIESQCGPLDHAILFSEAFAGRLSRPVTQVAHCDLKGLSGRVPVFTA